MQVRQEARGRKTATVSQTAPWFYEPAVITDIAQAV